MLLLIQFLLLLPLFMGVLCHCFLLRCFLSVLSGFAIILMGTRELAAFLWLSSECLVKISILCLFLTVPFAGLQCVTVSFPDYIHLLFSVSAYVLQKDSYMVE